MRNSNDYLKFSYFLVLREFWSRNRLKITHVHDCCNSRYFITSVCSMAVNINTLLTPRLVEVSIEYSNIQWDYSILLVAVVVFFRWRQSIILCCLPSHILVIVYSDTVRWVTLFIFVNLLQYYLHTVAAWLLFQDVKAILIGQYVSVGGKSG